MACDAPWHAGMAWALGYMGAPLSRLMAVGRITAARSRDRAEGRLDSREGDRVGHAVEVQGQADDGDTSHSGERRFTQRVAFEGGAIAIGPIALPLPRAIDFRVVEDRRIDVGSRVA